jgi:hypothetical protein
VKRTSSTEPLFCNEILLQREKKDREESLCGTRERKRIGEVLGREALGNRSSERERELEKN